MVSPSRRSHEDSAPIPVAGMFTRGGSDTCDRDPSAVGAVELYLEEGKSVAGSWPIAVAGEVTVPQRRVDQINLVSQCMMLSASWRLS